MEPPIAVLVHIEQNVDADHVQTGVASDSIIHEHVLQQRLNEADLLSRTQETS